MVKNEAPLLVALVLDDKKSKKTGAVYIYNKARGIDEGQNKIIKAKEEIGHIDFYIEEGTKTERACIHCTDVNVTEEFQKNGYGRLMMKTICAYAKELNLPVTLFSVDDAVSFYKKCGFVRNPKETSAQDLIWYPRKQSKRKKVKKKKD